jgi:hypothetical protein
MYTWTGVRHAARRLRVDIKRLRLVRVMNVLMWVIHRRLVTMLLMVSVSGTVAVSVTISPVASAVHPSHAHIAAVTAAHAHAAQAVHLLHPHVSGGLYADGTHTETAVAGWVCARLRRVEDAHERSGEVNVRGSLFLDRLDDGSFPRGNDVLQLVIDIAYLGV